jgi:hypothetical protein
MQDCGALTLKHLRRCLRASYRYCYRDIPGACEGTIKEMASGACEGTIREMAFRNLLLSEEEGGPWKSNARWPAISVKCFPSVGKKTA